MKSFVTTIASLVTFLAITTGSAHAAGRVEKAADELSNLLSNGDAETVVTEGGDAETMARAYFLARWEDDEDLTVVRDATAFNQEEHEVGFFRNAAVAVEATLAELNYCVENDMVDSEGTDPEANAKFTATAKRLVRALRMPGVVFAYDASGQGWGGMPITILLAIDTKTKRVHAITMQCHAYHD